MKYQNRYRIKSARAPWWNYSWVGSYFITMVTDDRACIFGEIRHGEMYLSTIGEIVLDEWQKSFQIRSNGVAADETIKNYGVAYRPPRSISSFVAGFKSAATKRINEYRNTPRKPVWQPRFHDRIIRNTREYQRIIWYIRNNPKKWQEDRFRENDENPTDVSEKTSVKQKRYNRINRINRTNRKIES
jgi:putative transposase